MVVQSPHSPRVPGFPPTSKKKNHDHQWLGYTKLPLGWYEGMRVCPRCPVMDWCLIESVFLPHAECSRGRIRIHHIRDQDKAATEHEWL